MGFLSGVLSAGTLGLYNPKSERTSTATQTGSIDQALVPLRKSIVDQSLALQPQQAYQGQRVAGLSPLQTQAFQQIGALGGQGQQLAQKGFNILGGVGSAADRISAYQNPYTQEVLDRSMSDLERQRQIALQQSEGQSLANNAFGGSRQAVREALTNENYAKQMADTAANLRYQGFNTALGAAQQDVQQQQQLAQALQSAGYNAIGALGGAGDQQQAQTQAELDAAKAAFYEPNDLAMQRLNFLTGIASGVPQANSMTQVGVAAPNTATNFFGNLSSLANATSKFGGMAKGG